MKIEAQRIRVHDEILIQVTISSKGNWGHSLLTDQHDEVMNAAQAAASDITDKINRIPKKARG
jgi:hypothetical protein